MASPFLRLGSSSAAISTSTIDDPSDWPLEYRDLATFDQALRCPMCGDLFTTALMVIKCGHNFCSLCIRHRISASDTSCPVCREDVKEADLRPNRIIDDLVAAFTSCRSKMLAVARQDPSVTRAQRATSEPADAPSPRTPHVDSAPSSDAPTRSLRKRPRRTPVIMIDADDDYEAPNNNDDGDDDAFEPSPHTAAADHDSDPDFHPSSSSRSTKPCPVCHRRIHKDKLTHHVNACLDGTASPRTPPRTAPAPPPTKRARPASAEPMSRLPRVHYHTLKDTKVRALLQNAGLATRGPRDKLIARHKAWVLLYNANVDADPVRRRSLVDLRRQLNSEERARDMHAQETAGMAGMSLQMHVQKYAVQFDELVEAARKSRDAARAVGKVEEGGVEGGEGGQGVPECGDVATGHGEEGMVEAAADWLETGESSMDVDEPAQDSPLDNRLD
ncbi:DNA repair protein rad18 [Allomyces macrogynus ATCC 38327]|uniref:Postreplication repair E3 ubiquitin-protein ligase RAD18 n=1 Tax=Allomyces macrogynus (strain ATCC 38327) TaxID=578462 RepID=A0A0L0S5Y5_ALLM3|nr:DNA repair protein rad18 [Allomyces macrogynus ATCC 38327]|eukprot:KNE57831.1 DNA repair protein rad18 [Allomyces macrogynus ATCC 38327]